ncbi:MAG TPA: aspartyl protease family protein, partial [bacterium]|nr:aspartyl protease family protein [bacterium]
MAGTHKPAIAYVAQGTCETSGAQGSFQFTFDDDGRFILAVQGPLPEKIASDGRETWSTDWAELPRLLSLGEEQAERLGILGWMGSALDSTKLDPRLHAEIERDERGVPIRVSRRGMEGTETWRFMDIHESEGRLFAQSVRVDVDGELSRTFQVKSFERAPYLSRNVYQRPVERPHDARFNASLSAALPITRARTGHVLTKASIDGGEAGWFILDTGAGGSTLIDATLGQKLDAPNLGSIPAVGVFGKILMTVRRAKTLTIGPLTIERPFLLEQDLSFLSPIHDEPILGILGYDVLSRCMVEIDLGAGAFSLHDPATFANSSAVGDSSGATSIVWEPLPLPYRVPLVFASYEGGRKGFFRIDVGAAGQGFGNVAFHSPIVERSELLHD